MHERNQKIKQQWEQYLEKNNLLQNIEDYKEKAKKRKEEKKQLMAEMRAQYKEDWRKRKENFDKVNEE